MKKLPKIKLIIVGIFLSLAIAFIHYISKKLPLSKVSLTFQGWKTYGTNVDAVFYLSNSGPRTIYWERYGETIFETEAGWATNRQLHFTYTSLGTPPGSNEIDLARIPLDANSWRIKLEYSSYQKHNFRLETIRGIVNSGAANYLQNFTGDCIGRILRLFPDPKEEYHETFSDIFTNKPPVAPIESAKSP